MQPTLVDACLYISRRFSKLIVRFLAENANNTGLFGLDWTLLIEPPSTQKAQNWKLLSRLEQRLVMI
jgi:hypothetical protein